MLPPCVMHSQLRPRQFTSPRITSGRRAPYGANSMVLPASTAASDRRTQPGKLQEDMCSEQASGPTGRKLSPRNDAARRLHGRKVLSERDEFEPTRFCNENNARWNIRLAKGNCRKTVWR